jgi:hypothetical protein
LLPSHASTSAKRSAEHFAKIFSQRAQPDPLAGLPGNRSSGRPAPGGYLLANRPQAFHTEGFSQEKLGLTDQDFDFYRNVNDSQ